MFYVWYVFLFLKLYSSEKLLCEFRDEDPITIILLSSINLFIFEVILVDINYFDAQLKNSTEQSFKTKQIFAEDTRF